MRASRSSSARTWGFPAGSERRRRATWAGQIRSRELKIHKVGVEKTLDGKRWIEQIHGGYRLGSIDSNSGGWKNGKRSAGSILDAPEPLIKFTIPQCEPLNVRAARRREA